MTFFTSYPSPIGTLLLISDGEALTQLHPGIPDPAWISMEELAIFDSVRHWLDAYFTGTPLIVNFPVSPAGTDFQIRVWALLQRIPYGNIVTYGQLARHFGDNMSAQAIGQAVGKNPIAIIIPCHRCVGSRGQLTGYAWGIERKEWLLRHEEDRK